MIQRHAVRRERKELHELLIERGILVPRHQNVHVLRFRIVMKKNAQQFIPCRCGAQDIHRELIPSIDQSLIREELRDLRQLLKNRVERKLDDVDGRHGRSADAQNRIMSLFQSEIRRIYNVFLLFRFDSSG